MPFGRLASPVLKWSGPCVTVGVLFWKAPNIPWRTVQLIGKNSDGSGDFTIYLDGETLRTFIDVDGKSEESARQDLVPAPDFESANENWYIYGSNGRTCDIHIDGEHARVDGLTYRLTSRTDW